MFFTESDKQRLLRKYNQSDADKIKEEYLKEKGFINLNQVKKPDLNTNKGRALSYFGSIVPEKTITEPVKNKKMTKKEKKEARKLAKENKQTSNKGFQGFKLRPRKKEFQFF